MIRPHARFGSLLVLAVLGGGACGGKPGSPPEAGLTGRWRGTTTQGSEEITIEDRGASLVIRVENEEAVGQRVAGGRFEGQVTGSAGTLRFVLERRGAQLAGRFTLITPDGRTREAPEVLYSRVEEGAGEGAGGGSPGGGGGERPEALVGHWRYTETFARDGISWATDNHLVLEVDGVCRSWSRTEGSVSSSEPEERGRWKTEGRDLLLQPLGGGGWQPAGRFAADGDRLMLTLPNGDKRVFERL
jgi:hypothetical protein